MLKRSGPFQGIALPTHWPSTIKWAVIETICLAHRAITTSRSYAVNSKIERVRLAGELDELRAENAMLREEIRIKDSRMAKIRPRNRQHYLSEERMAILELKAVPLDTTRGLRRAWNLAETSRTFLLEPDTISCWIERTAAHNDSLL